MPDKEETMPDIPVPDQCSIILYSNTPGYDKEGGTVYQNIRFTAKTKITVSGGLSNDFCRITPSGDSFEVVATGAHVGGYATFSATASTEGNPDLGLTSATETFQFNIICFDNDVPFTNPVFFDIPVGKYFDGYTLSFSHFSIEPAPTFGGVGSFDDIVSMTSGKIKWAEDPRGFRYEYWDGDKSGLNLDGVIDEFSQALSPPIIAVNLNGVASRPGIYMYQLSIDTSVRGGLRCEPYQFCGSGGNPILLIFNIYDDRETPMLLMPSSYVPDINYFYVLTRGTCDVEDTLACETWLPPANATNNDGYTFMGPYSKDTLEDGEIIWSYTKTFTYYGWTTSTTSHYDRRIRKPANGHWYFEIRYYESGNGGRAEQAEDRKPWQLMATNPSTFGDIPPNNGWSNDLRIVGSYSYYVPNYGFFDYKGDTPFEDDPDVLIPVYEQQVVMAAQYEGWKNPPAIQHDDGKFLIQAKKKEVNGIEELVWALYDNPYATGSGEEVEPQTIQNTVVPYMPSTGGKDTVIAGLPYRDISLCAPLVNGTPPTSIPINAHLDGDLFLNSQKYVAGVLPHYTWLRQAVPPNNATKKYTVRLNVESSSVTEDKMYGDYCATSGEHFEAGNGESESKWEYENDITGSFDLDVFMRTKGLMTDVLGGMRHVPADVNIVEYYEALHTDTEDDGYESHTYHYNDYIEFYPDPVDSATYTAHLMLASGRNEADDYVGGYGAIYANLKSDPVGGHIKDWTEYPGSDTPTDVHGDRRVESYASASGGVLSPFAFALKFDELKIEPITVETEKSQYTITNGKWQSHGHYDLETGDSLCDSSSGSGKTYTVNHSHTCYECANRPKGLLDKGNTYVYLHTEVGHGCDEKNTTTTHEVYVNDPRGEYAHSVQTANARRQTVDCNAANKETWQNNSADSRSSISVQITRYTISTA